MLQRAKKQKNFAWIPQTLLALGFGGIHRSRRDLRHTLETLAKNITRPEGPLHALLSHLFPILPMEQWELWRNPYGTA